MTDLQSKQVSGYPGNDERYKAIERTMKIFQYERDALLEVLNTAQETFGYLSEELLLYVSRHLHVPLSQIYGVATFYDRFTLETTGEHHCLVCTDPVCSIAGGEEVLIASQRHAVESDGKITVRRATCLGLCDQAPAVLNKGIAYVNLKADEVTAVFSGEAARARLQVTGESRVMTAPIGEVEPTDLASHRQRGAFSALEKALTEMTPEDVIAEVKTSGLAGRGGANFPTGLKWEFTRKASGQSKYIVCNFDESEPGTFKDRVMVQGNPFRAIEGLIISGYAVGASQGYIFVRNEYPEATEVLQDAIEQLYETHLLGEHILGTDFHFDLEVRRGAGAYICGEETALFEAIEGKRGYPRIKPPFPTTHGLFGQPTSINNVETLAVIPELILHGGNWMRQWGTEKSPGIKLFCLSGHVKQPGVVEVPYGITVRELIEQYGGGFDGKPQAILMGGAAGGLLHPEHFDTPLTHEALNPLGAPIGSGSINVFNRSVKLLDILKMLMRFFVHESCGQCTPCRVGLGQVYKLLDTISDGKGTAADLDKLEHLCQTIRTTSLCGLGQSAPNSVISSLKIFRHEYEALIQTGEEVEV